MSLLLVVASPLQAADEYAEIEVAGRPLPPVVDNWGYGDGAGCGQFVTNPYATEEEWVVCRAQQESQPCPATLVPDGPWIADEGGLPMLGYIRQERRSYQVLKAGYGIVGYNGSDPIYGCSGTANTVRSLKRFRAVNCASVYPGYGNDEDIDMCVSSAAVQRVRAVPATLSRPDIPDPVSDHVD